MPAYSDGEHVGSAPVNCKVAAKALNVLA
jgi:diacylglycerol kinase family enzyme